MDKPQSVLLASQKQTLLMKSLNYMGSELENNLTLDCLNKLRQLQAAGALTGDNSYQIINEYVGKIEKSIDTPNLVLDRPLLYAHLHFFNPKKFTIWQQISRPSLEEAFSRSNALHLLGYMLAFNDAPAAIGKNTHLHYCLSENSVLRYSNYFQYAMNANTYIFSPLIGISHAHIKHILSSLTLFKAGEVDEFHLIIEKSSSANFEHIKILQAELRVKTHRALQLLTHMCDLSILYKLALYGDRISILISNIKLASHNRASSKDRINLMHANSLFEGKINPLVRNSIPIVSSDCPRRHDVILLHNRDSAYKQQPHLSYRDSDINLIAAAANSVYPQCRLVRIGASGHPINVRTSVADLTELLTKQSEVTLLRRSALLISTTSGPGMFSSELYGITSILLNCTNLVTGDLVSKHKIIGLRYILPESVAGLTRQEFLRMLLMYWSDAQFKHRQLTEAELVSSLECVRSRQELPLLTEIDRFFNSALGDLSLQPILPVTADNLVSCIKATKY